MASEPLDCSVGASAFQCQQRNHRPSRRRSHAIEYACSPGDPGEPSSAEPPQILASSKARQRTRLHFPVEPATSAGPNQHSTDLREDWHKVVNHNGAPERQAIRFKPKKTEAGAR